MRDLHAEVERLRHERDHYRAWIKAMLDDHHLWRDQGEERMRWNVRTTLAGALDIFPGAEEHRPVVDDGVTYCGWDKHGGCGEVWPCSTVRSQEHDDA